MQLVVAAWPTVVPSSPGEMMPSTSFRAATPTLMLFLSALSQLLVWPPTVNRDRTVRAGSSSTCWLSISAKLNASDIESPPHGAPAGRDGYLIDGLPIRHTYT